MKFKNTFRVKGSTALLKAFCEEITELGWKFDLENFNEKCSPFEDKSITGIQCRKGYWYGQEYTTLLKECIDLTTDWNLALNLAKEQEEEIPEYVEWINYIGYNNSGTMCDKSHFIRGKVFCTKTDIFPPSIFNEKQISSTNIGVWKKGLTEDYYKQNFKSSTKEAYDKQKQLEIELIDGEWYYSSNNENVHSIFKYKKYIENESNDKIGCYLGIIYYKNLENSFQENDNNLTNKEIVERLATSEEIKNCLIKFAEKKGFVEGIKFISPDDKNKLRTFGVGKYRKNKNREYDSLFNYINNNYSNSFDILRVVCGDGQGCSNPLIYKNGKWVEIVKYPQIEINGYKAEFFDNYVGFGCAKIGKELFISIEELNRLALHDSNRQIEEVMIGIGKFTKNQIKEITEYYLNKNQ